MKRCAFNINFFLVIIVVTFAYLPIAHGESYIYYSPEQAIHAYIDGYLQVPIDVDRIVTADSHFFAQIISKMIQAPRGFKHQEYEKARMEVIDSLSKFEKSKRAATFIFNNALRINDRAGHRLYSILYKGMKYKILEVRDGHAPLSHSPRKEAFVELRYMSSKSAPTGLGNKKIKKTVVRLVFAEWKAGSKVNYKIDHYEPTEYGLEYFSHEDRLSKQIRSDLYLRTKKEPFIKTFFLAGNTSVIRGKKIYAPSGYWHLYVRQNGGICIGLPPSEIRMALLKRVIDAAIVSGEELIKYNIRSVSKTVRRLP